jgi:hypothetical protein
MTSGNRQIARYTPPQPANDSLAWVGPSYPVAAFVCAIGFFMRIVLSGPVLNIMGIPYGDEDAAMLAKIHPGTWFILLSFLILIFSRHNPLEQMFRIAREQTIFFSFIVIYSLILIYWVLRGPKGVGLILDVHIVMPICAIVFCYAPRSYCRVIVYLYAAIAIINSLVGIGESITHLRLFAFDPDWEVLKQDYFRSSAFLGHPLTNASFTAVAMFVLLALRMPSVAKGTILLVMLSSLVAFGGRSSLGISMVGLTVLGVINVRNYFTSNARRTVLQMMLLVLGIVLIPLTCIILLYGALHSGMGERLMAYRSLTDDSAGVRLMAFDVFGQMTPADMIFGLDGDRIAAIGSHTGLANPMSDIENPWVLMFMFLGMIMFSVWLCGLAACIWRLMAGASPALKIAVVEYFVIASASNSFGRKDPVYFILAGIVVCVKRLNSFDNLKRGETSP